MEYISHSLDETEKAAADFIATLSPGAARATVVGLQGNLGSGKTTFVQMVARVLGVREHVTSPTFVIQKTYNLQPTTYNLGFEKLVHIDAHRLDSGEELEKIGWQATLEDPKNVILLEWPERVSDVLPGDTIFIAFEYIDEHIRRITT